jgi:hypothetical protein
MANIGQHFAVQQYIGFLQRIDKSAVGQAMRSGGCADSRNPKLPKIPLSIFSPGIGVLLSLID